MSGGEGRGEEEDVVTRKVIVEEKVRQRPASRCTGNAERLLGRHSNDDSDMSGGGGQRIQ